MNYGECILFPEGSFIPHNCPSTLLNFISMARSLAMPRELVDLHKQETDQNKKDLFCLPSLSLHMTPKKKHEVEKLANFVSAVVDHIAANTVIDVGSGEGYLTQVYTLHLYSS